MNGTLRRIEGHVTVIAEAAQGYEGDPTLARLLVRAARQGCADAIKFQLVYADELATPAYRHYTLFSRLEMPVPAWKTVADEAEQQEIALFFDVFGDRSLEEALSLGAAGVKVHATDFFNDSLVHAALGQAGHVYFSAGGIDLSDIETFVDRHIGTARDRWTLMQGFQAEPTAIGDNHLARLGALRKRFPEVRLGFMDHADGGSDEAQWLGVLALPYGVSAIEKHITLDRSLGLEDSVSALSAEFFGRYVARVRAAEAALGSDSLSLTDAEMTYRRRALKVVVSTRSLSPGGSIAATDVMLRRAPLDDAREPVYRLEAGVGRRLKQAVGAHQPIYRDQLA